MQLINLISQVWLVNRVERQQKPGYKGKFTRHIRNVPNKYRCATTCKGDLGSVVMRQPCTSHGVRTLSGIKWRVLRLSEKTLGIGKRIKMMRSVRLAEGWHRQRLHDTREDEEIVRDYARSLLMPAIIFCSDLPPHVYDLVRDITLCLHFSRCMKILLGY